MNIKCSKCGTDNSVSLVRTREYKNRFRPNWIGVTKFYADEFGRMSRGLMCHDCCRLSENKRTGHGRKDDSTFAKNIKSKNAEMIAEKHFQSLGFKVNRVNYTGPDLFCDMGKFRWTVEVKRARDVHPKNHPGSTWVSDRVHPKRQKDDLIAFVLPNNRVYIDSMENHLKHCHGGGGRTITAIVKEFGLT